MMKRILIGILVWGIGVLSWGQTLDSRLGHGGEFVWKMAKASETRATAAELSSPGFDDARWMEAIVPGTVLTSLVENGVYPEPYYGTNNKISEKKTNHYDLPWDMLVANGYAFMSARYTQITGDGGKRGGLFNGVCELWGERDFSRADNPGSLIIWAWGLMRGLDLAEKIPERVPETDVLPASAPDRCIAMFVV